jgi:hypothetical protein
MAKKDKRKIISQDSSSSSSSSAAAAAALAATTSCNDQNKNHKKSKVERIKPKKENEKEKKEKEAEKGKGLDMFDELFATKKENEMKQKKEEMEEEKRREEHLKMFRSNNNTNSNTSAGVNLKNAKKIELTQDRNDVGKIKKGEWANDGLGGVFDVDGFTGRKQEGVKIFKAHLFNKKGFGTTEDCPFDCDCCYI